MRLRIGLVVFVALFDPCVAGGRPSLHERVVRETRDIDGLLPIAVQRGKQNKIGEFRFFALRENSDFSAKLLRGNGMANHQLAVRPDGDGVGERRVRRKPQRCLAIPWAGQRDNRLLRGAVGLT